MRGGGGGLRGSQAKGTVCAHGAQINFGDPSPYLTYGISSRLLLRIAWDDDS
jgi:hypothetical protein